MWWPTQFVGSDGCLLPSGAFDRGEVPFGATTCMVCSWTAAKVVAGSGASVEPPFALHLRDQGHRQRSQRVREDYICFWQELAAPDERPYYYDHVSHTWSFAKPRYLTVLRTRPSGEELSSAGAADSARVLGLRERLARVVAPDSYLPAQSEQQVAEGYVQVGTDPNIGFKCLYCFRILGTEWAAMQHLQALAGRKGHPPIRGVATNPENAGGFPGDLGAAATVSAAVATGAVAVAGAGGAAVTGAAAFGAPW